MATSKKKRAGRGRLVFGTLFVMALAGVVGWLVSPSPSATVGTRSAPPAIPVTVKTIQPSDFSVYLDGLGTIQPYDTVTVRSRVDGQVIKVDFRQGQMVKKGDVLVQIDPRPYQATLEQAQAKKAQDEATLKNAEIDLQRYRTLGEQQFASRQQLDTQQALVNQLTAQIKGDQANIDSAQTQLSYTTIRSPLTGKTGFRLIDPGNIVHASDSNGIVTIVKLQPISAVFTAPEERINDINAALSHGHVPVEALTSSGSKVLATGHLALVDNQVNQASGTISMKATFQNKDNALWPGLSVSTRLLLNTQHDVLAVPNDAIQHGPDGLYLFVVGNNNRVQIHPIKVGNEGTDNTVVTSGLSAGDRIVVAGAYRLTVNTLVAPREQPGAAVAASQPASPVQEAQ